MVGCASTEKKSTPLIEVKIPVGVCTTPPIITRPSLPVARLTVESDDEKVVRAYKTSIIILKSYATKLERALKVYK